MNDRDLTFQPQQGGTHAILVAARQSGMRLLLACTFGGERYRLAEEETQEAAVTQAEISRPSLVVVDTDLAEGDGVETCRRIKNGAITRYTAVVVISGQVNRQEYERAVAAGADAFLTKPFSPSRLLQIARDVCSVASVERAGAAAHTGWEWEFPHPDRFDTPWQRDALPMRLRGVRLSKTRVVRAS